MIMMEAAGIEPAQDSYRLAYNAILTSSDPGA
jgi:hypothetical protein